MYMIVEGRKKDNYKDSKVSNDRTEIFKISLIF
jgi:hypothetical protein